MICQVVSPSRARIANKDVYTVYSRSKVIIDMPSCITKSRKDSKQRRVHHVQSMTLELALNRTATTFKVLPFVQVAFSIFVFTVLSPQNSDIYAASTHTTMSCSNLLARGVLLRANKRMVVAGRNMLPVTS